MAAKKSKGKAPEAPETQESVSDFDVMEVRAFAIQPLVSVVEGCPKDKQAKLTLDLLLMIASKVEFLDVTLKKLAGTGSKATNEARASRYA